MDDKEDKISDALERLALTIGESGAVPVPELVRALERAAERLRTRSAPVEAPSDLVTQAEASRSMGVSRQAVNQWVQKGLIGTHHLGRRASLVSLAEVAIAANRRAPAQFPAARRRELIAFLDLIEDASTLPLTSAIRGFLLEESDPTHPDQSRVLREFVIAAMDSGDRQREFTAEGVRLLADLNPALEVDVHTPFGVLAESLGLLIRSSQGRSGFDSPATAVLGLLGAATVGTQFAGDDTAVARSIARAAEEVWGPDWSMRMYDAAYHVGELRPAPLVRYTASLTYLDNHRFLRQAQSAGVSIAYSRGPGPLLPQHFYGAPIYADILSGDHREEPIWAFTPEAAAAAGRPVDGASGVNSFRAFNYEYGLLDASIHGIRRYCFSAAAVRAELRSTTAAMAMSERRTYLETAVATLARTIEQPFIELVAVAEFDWWKDHIIRSSEREILIGLRDDRARTVAHALLVQTSMLPDVVEAADSDGSLRDRLRIYVKNLEFEVVDARYRDDLRRGVTRIIKSGGMTLSHDEAVALAESEIDRYLH